MVSIGLSVNQAHRGLLQLHRSKTEHVELIMKMIRQMYVLIYVDMYIWTIWNLRNVERQNKHESTKYNACHLVDVFNI